MPLSAIDRRAAWLLVAAAPAAWLWLGDPFGVDGALVDGRLRLLLCAVSLPFVIAVCGAVQVAYLPLYELMVATRDRTALVAVWNERLLTLYWLAVVPALMLAGVRKVEWALAVTFGVAAVTAAYLEYQRRTRELVAVDELVWSDPEMEALPPRAWWGGSAAAFAIAVGMMGPVADGRLWPEPYAVEVAIALALTFGYIPPFYALTHLRFDPLVGVLPIGVVACMAAAWTDGSDALIGAVVAAAITALAMHFVVASAKRRRLRELTKLGFGPQAEARYGSGGAG